DVASALVGGAIERSPASTNLVANQVASAVGGIAIDGAVAAVAAAGDVAVGRFTVGHAAREIAAAAVVVALERAGLSVASDVVRARVVARAADITRTDLSLCATGDGLSAAVHALAQDVTGTVVLFASDGLRAGTVALAGQAGRLRAEVNQAGAGVVTRAVDVAVAARAALDQAR